MNPTAAIPTTQEAEALFQTLTVAKMREKRKEYNNGVEAKRQELRMLVGKRLGFGYRSFTSLSRCSIFWRGH